MQRLPDFSLSSHVLVTLVHSSFLWAIPSCVVNMDRSTAQVLVGLTPTLTGPLPPELLELAVSLLAQSRSKASSLKADEEIARSYACANLACERCEASPYSVVFHYLTDFYQTQALPKFTKNRTSPTVPSESVPEAL